MRHEAMMIWEWAKTTIFSLRPCQIVLPKTGQETAENYTPSSTSPSSRVCNKMRSRFSLPRNPRTYFILIALIFVVMCFLAMFMERQNSRRLIEKVKQDCQSIVSTIKAKAEPNQNAKANEVVDTDKVWPTYPDFDKVDVTAKTSKPDAELLKKLLADMKRIQTPVFRSREAPGEKNRIPKIIHQGWKDEKIPMDAVKWVKKWSRLHPDYKYMFWTDASAEAFVKEHYPRLFPYYDSWNIPVQKSDMFRALAIYAFGGFWADLDMEPQRNLDPVRYWSSCVLARHPEIQTYLIDVEDRGDIFATNYTYPINAFFACRVGHPYLFYLLSRLVLNSPKSTGHECTLSHTVGCSGPHIMALSAAFYRRSVPEKTRLKRRSKMDVIIPQSIWFMPTFDVTYKYHIEWIVKVCAGKLKSDLEKKLCNDYYTIGNKVWDISYTIHHFFHSYNFNKDTKYKSDDQTLEDLLETKVYSYTDTSTFSKEDISSFL